MHMRKAWFCCIGCLIAGFVIGYFITQARDGSVIAKTMALDRFAENANAQDRAFRAYQHENRSVAIYALNEALDGLKTTEDFGAPPYYTDQMMASDELLLHGRLARLYLATGQTNLCEQQVADALKCAHNAPAYLTITNQAGLMKLISEADNAAK